ncbi:MAG: hypothetical protein WCJ61_07620 [Paludibacter sp.]
MKTNEEKEIVFEIGGEGGSIAIYCERDKNGVKFIYNHNEIDFSDEGLSINKSDVYEDFESAFQIINERYSWHFLYLLTVDDAYKEYVSNHLINKLNQQKVLSDDFQNRSNFEKRLGVKFEFDNGRNKWKKRAKHIDQLIKEAGEFEVEKETESYFISYPHFLMYFASIEPDKIEKNNLVIGIHFVYGWMPTIFEFKNKENFEEAISILKKAKRGESLLLVDYEILKDLFNGSLVGSSKLLHFINPEKFAIWDSRVHRYLKNNLKSMNFTYDVGDVLNYEKYLEYLSEITESNDFEEFYNLVNDKIEKVHKYRVSKFRAIELIMFKNGKK